EIERYRRFKDKYIERVNNQISLMETRVSGRSVLAEFAGSSYSLVIIPDDPSNKKFTKDNAAEQPDNPADGTATAMPLLDSNGKPIGGSGMGTGTNATIFYRPEAWGVFGTASTAAAPSNRPDEVLLHEMVHAARDMKGVSYLLPMAKGYENEEEFLAIVITNVYLSEKGQTALAADHIST